MTTAPSEASPAAILYVFTVALLLTVIALAILADAVLAFSRQPTMTAFLRAHPLWFFMPAALLLLFLLLLAVHLKAG